MTIDREKKDSLGKKNYENLFSRDKDRRRQKETVNKRRRKRVEKKFGGKKKLRALHLKCNVGPAI
jgi:hypothetical protein